VRSLRPRKRFGQHFLQDAAIIARLLDAFDPRRGDRCVEIGPGRGALTVPLLECLGDLDVVEIDRDLAAALGARFGGDGGLRIHLGDALRFDFSALNATPRQLRVVGNLPYNISTPLLFHLFGHAPAIRDMHVMLQREVVERLTAAPGCAGYGRLSVMTQYHCRPTMLFTVAPSAFEPEPKVYSALVRLVPHRTAPVRVRDPRCFQQVVASAFSQRRKTLRNSLGKLLPTGAIAAAGIDPSVRPQTLDLRQFAALANALAG